MVPVGLNGNLYITRHILICPYHWAYSPFSSRLKQMEVNQKGVPQKTTPLFLPGLPWLFPIRSFWGIQAPGRAAQRRVRAQFLCPTRLGAGAVLGGGRGAELLPGLARGAAPRRSDILRMDEIHFAPQKPRNDSIPLQIPINNGFPWFLRWCRIASIHSMTMGHNLCRSHFGADEHVPPILMFTRGTGVCPTAISVHCTSHQKGMGWSPHSRDLNLFRKPSEPQGKQLVG